MSYVISINDYANGKLTIANKSSKFTVSGLVNAPNGFLVVMNFGIRKYSSVVRGGAFSFNVPIRVKAQSYKFSLSLRDRNNRSVTIRKVNGKNIMFEVFNLLFVDTVGPSVPTNLVFSRSLGSNKNQFRLTWKSSIDEFGIYDYIIYKNGESVDREKVNRYLTGAMQPGVVDAYRIKAVDDSGNVSDYSIGIAISLKKDNTVSPAMTVIDNMGFVYNEIENNDGELVAGPIAIDYDFIRDNSDMCDVNNSKLSLVVSAIDSSKGVFMKGEDVLEVGDVIEQGDEMFWVPSAHFPHFVTPINFKVKNVYGLESNVSVPFNVRTVKNT